MNPGDRIIWAQTGGGKRIGTAKDRITAVKDGLPLAHWFARVAQSQAFSFNPISVGTVQAEINHGRWIVKCPFCSGAEEADPQQPVFYCLSCGNLDNGSHVMTVIFPAEARSLEGLLLRREIENRNWLPGETVADLEAENLEHEV